MLRDSNDFTIRGHVGGDVTVDDGEKGKYCRFRMATNRSYKDQEGEWQTKTTWFTVTHWGERAVKIGKLITNGMHLQVEGRIETRMYTDQNGVEKEGFGVRAQEIFEVKDILK